MKKRAAKKMIGKSGILLLFVGLALMIHAQCNLEITSGAEAVFGSEDATIYDAGLICEKLNLTIIAGIVFNIRDYYGPS